MTIAQTWHQETQLDEAGIECREQVELKRQASVAAEDLSKALVSLNEAKKAKKRVDAVVTVKVGLSCYTLIQLGQGKSN